MSLFLKYARIHIRSLMQYKTSFILSFIGQFFMSFSVLISIYFVYLRFNTVQGFTLNDILICFAVILMSFSMAEIVFRGFDRFPPMIQSGDFDRLMLRPQNIILQVLGMKLDLARGGRLFQAILVFIYIIPKSDIIWTIDKIAVLVNMIIGGVFFFAALFMLYAFFSFYTIQGLEFMNILTDGGREFGKYPLSIYGKKYLSFFTYIIPMACFQYYPFLYLVGRSDNILYGFLPFVCVVFYFICLKLFYYGMGHYQSTGS